MRKQLAEYLAMPYRFIVEADPDVGCFVSYPDLQGCMTQVDRADLLGPAADEIRVLWLETAYAQGLEIPETEAATGADAVKGGGRHREHRRQRSDEPGPRAE